MSVSTDDVKKLAELSRIELSEEEVAAFQKEIGAILTYIDEIQKVDLPEGVAPSPHVSLTNVMREDGEPHEPGAYADTLLGQAPAKDGKFLKVKKILGG